jgi:hypothetical protein
MKLMDLPEISQSEPAATAPDIEPLADDNADAENEAGEAE